MINIPENPKKKWFNIIDDVKRNEWVTIQGCYYLNNFSDPISKNDASNASEVGFGCCVYIE